MQLLAENPPAAGPLVFCFGAAPPKGSSKRPPEGATACFGSRRAKRRCSVRFSSLLAACAQCHRSVRGQRTKRSKAGRFKTRK